MRDTMFQHEPACAGVIIIEDDEVVYAYMYMPTEEAQLKALRKYKEKSYDRLEISVAKGKKTNIQAHASGPGESLNGFVNRAIDETLKRDYEKSRLQAKHKQTVLVRY